MVFFMGLHGRVNVYVTTWLYCNINVLLDHIWKREVPHWTRNDEYLSLV